MKQTSVQNLIINALLIVEAVLIVFFLLRMITKPRDKEAGAVVPDRELTIAEQEGEIPLPPVVGNSKPVDVEPVDGIRITAAENALDKDREFKITPVSDQDWDSMEKRLSEVSDEQMLFCFDLDAGMGPEEHLPGEFTFSMDLEKMGIPPILYDKLTVWRLVGDQMYKYTSWVENGKIVFRSDQNSALVVGCILAGLGVLVYSGETWHKHHTTGDLYKNFFTLKDDAVRYDIKDTYGDFTLYFRFTDSEDADRFDAFKDAKKNLERRTRELEEKAEAEYNRQVEEKYNAERAEWTMWQKVMGSAEAKRKARAAIDKAAILAQYQKEDILFQKYTADAALPASIIDIGEQLKVANRYLTDNQVCRPQTRNLEVNLVDTEHAGTSLAEYRNTATKMPYIFVNYEELVKGRTSYTRKGKGEAMLITLTHELYHHRQKCKFLDFRTEETTAAYIETGAAKYYVEHGEISPDTDNETLCFTHRTHYERFAMPFNHMVVIGNADEAYTYADFMDFLERKTRQKKPLMGGALITEYSYSATHAENYMKWFGIKDEKTFARYLEEFCLLHVSDIYLVLKGLEKESDRLKPVIVSREKPIVQVPLGSPGIGLSYYVAPFELMDNSKAPFNAFVSWKDVHYDHDYLSFYIGTSPGYSTVEKGEFFSGEKWWHQGACFSGKPANTVLYQSFTVVALYAPDAPVIKKVKKNYVRFVLPKADKDMVKKGYITGALVRCLSADGTERYILAQPEKFGKEVKWSIDGIGDSGFSLRVKWIRQNEDGSTYESPLSKPAAHGALPAEKEEPVTESANVGKEKDVEKKPKASQEGEEKLVIYEKVRDLPWRAVNVSLYLDELEKQELVDFDRKVCHVIGSFGWGNGVDYPYIAGQTEGMLDKGVYIHHPIKGLSVNSNVKFVETGEGYTLSGVMKESGDADGGSLKDGAYQLDVTLVFDEDLKLLKGKFEGSSKQMRKITYYRQPSSNGKNVVNYYRDNPWFPTDMVYSGSFTAEEIYSDSNSELLYYAKYDSLNMQGNWKEDAYTANKQFGEAVVEKHFSKGLSDAVSKGIKVKIELIKCED